ncbi:hypothetical protein TSUD_57830 [Trifolium subterraneum]|uniref:Uncharacterized protein n=1 Tax=Trifolium subterraneum TaxID=3900 RepID=A0A2Z6N043_TRISU|nr:hypothetical protein TSUD_57830 [Trifolium subterraneum]
MPKRKTSKDMEAKITDLENELAAMKVTFTNSIAEIQQTARENQATLVQMMERVVGKRTSAVEDGSSSERNVVLINDGPQSQAKVSSPETSNAKSLQGEMWEEFRRSVKKVELPVFTGDDPALLCFALHRN